MFVVRCAVVVVCSCCFVLFVFSLFLLSVVALSKLVFRLKMFDVYMIQNLFRTFQFSNQGVCVVGLLFCCVCVLLTFYMFVFCKYFTTIFVASKLDFIKVTSKQVNRAVLVPFPIFGISEKAPFGRPFPLECRKKSKVFPRWEHARLVKRSGNRGAGETRQGVRAWSLSAREREKDQRGPGGEGKRMGIGLHDTIECLFCSRSDSLYLHFLPAIAKRGSMRAEVTPS